MPTTFSAALISHAGIFCCLESGRRRRRRMPAEKFYVQTDKKMRCQGRKLGDSDLVISETTLGTASALNTNFSMFNLIEFQMTFGQQNTEKEAQKQLSYALQQGVNVILLKWFGTLVFPMKLHME